MQDLRDVGTDVYAPGIMDRPWPWFLSCIRGILSTPPVFVPLATMGNGWMVQRAYRTRTQVALYGEPKFDALMRPGVNDGTA